MALCNASSLRPVAPRWARVASLILVISSLLVAVTVPVRSAEASPLNEYPYIVVLSEEAADVPSVALILTNVFGGEVGYVYEHALEGFSVTMTETAAQALAQSPLVAWVEPVIQLEMASQSVPIGYERIGGLANPELGAGGTGLLIDVDVAVLDTGVDLEHGDLDVVGGVTCASRTNSATCVDGGDDDHYHGTHVAGTIGALDNGVGVLGVAPGARIWAVKVLDSSGIGSTAGVIAGIDWVTANADTIEIANMSLSGLGNSAAQYQAIQNAVDAGVAFAVAAGNDGVDAGAYSPASFDNVLTVSAMADYDGQPGGLAGGTCRADADDTLAGFSNRGPAVEIAAPGTCILSTVPDDLGSYAVLSGTSMASPHVAGAMALLAASDAPSNSAEVEALYDTIIATGNRGWTDNSNDGWIEPLLDVTRLSPTLGLLAPADSAAGSGDVNCDKAMTIVDALMIAQFSSGNRADAGTCAFGDATSEIFVGAGDVNDDGSVNITDALLIARCAAGIAQC